jgi:hypothetical protein
VSEPNLMMSAEVALQSGEWVRARDGFLAVLSEVPGAWGTKALPRRCGGSMTVLDA